MTTTKMSLHRVIAEIKSIEAKLQQATQLPFVYMHIGEPNDSYEEAVKTSQSNYDKVNSQVANLATLKAARNKANSTVQVVVGGKSLTIDEALAQKAALPFKQNLVNTLQNQFNQAEQRLKIEQDKIEQKINQQIGVMFTGTRKATQEELDVIRSGFERGNKPVVIHMTGLKANVELLKKEIEDFTTEVDFVLSEANATNSVDITLI